MMQQAQTTSNPTPRLLPPRRAAAELGLPEYTIRQWLATGFVKGIPVGRKTLINIDLLRRKLEGD